MHIDSFFALHNSNLEDAEFVIFGIPYDATQSFKPGSRFAPNAIRVASWNLEAYSLFFDVDLESRSVCDAGNVNVDGGFSDVLENVRTFVRGLNGIPIVLGGEHTVSYAVLKALNLKDVYFVVFDAHYDLRDEFDGSKFNHACTTRRIFELGMKGIVQVGVRSGTKDERRFAEDNGFLVINPWNMEGWIERIEEYIGDRSVYLSIDIDAFDPSFAPGVSTPEPFGLNPVVMLEFFDRFSDRIVGMDIVEVVPDAEGVTPMLSARLIFEFVASK